MAKFKMEQKILKDIAGEVGKFTGKDGLIQHILVTVQKDSITFTATNGEITIERVVPLQMNEKTIGTVEQEGTFLISSKFEEIIKKLTDGEVSLTLLENNQIEVVSGKSSVKINGISGDFPALPRVDEENGVTLTAQVLRILVSQTGFAAADSDSRPILKAIHFNCDDGFQVIATDSHRLAKKKIPKSLNLPIMNIPAKALRDIISILDDDEKVLLCSSEQQVLLKTENKRLFIRQLNGNYPDVSRLIPEEGLTNVTVNTKDLVAAIDRASLFSKDKKNHSITLTTHEGVVRLTASSEETGQIEEEVEAKIEGENVSISFNSKFALDALKAFSVKTVTLKLNGSLRPILISSEEDPTLIQLILPIRTA